MNGLFEEKQRRNQEQIEKLILNKPLKDDNIKRFFMEHHGKKTNLFTPKETFKRFDFYVATYQALLFLDQHGGVKLPIGDSGEITTLRDRTLDVTDIMLRSMRGSSDYQLINGGLAALCHNFAQAFGPEYCKQFDNEIGQASLAILEQIPEINSLYVINSIKEIIRFFHIFLPQGATRTKYHLEKQCTESDLAKLLVAAVLQVKRKEIFKHATKPKEFSFEGEEIKKREAEADDIADQAEKERQQEFEEIQHKNKAYLAEIDGLRRSAAALKQLKAETKIKNKILGLQKKIIKAMDDDNEKTLTQARKELEKAEIQLQIHFDTDHSG